MPRFKVTFVGEAFTADEIKRIIKIWEESGPRKTRKPPFKASEHYPVTWKKFKKVLEASNEIALGKRKFKPGGKEG